MFLLTATRYSHNSVPLFAQFRRSLESPVSACVTEVYVGHSKSRCSTPPQRFGEIPQSPTVEMFNISVCWKWFQLAIGGNGAVNTPGRGPTLTNSVTAFGCEAIAVSEHNGPQWPQSGGDLQKAKRGVRQSAFLCSGAGGARRKRQVDTKGVASVLVASGGGDCAPGGLWQTRDRCGRRLGGRRKEGQHGLRKGNLGSGG